MDAPTAARAAALRTMRDVRAGALADHAFERAAAGLDGRDRAWTQELVYGTLRLRARLDHVLAGLSTRALDRLDPDVLDILRLGAYQLLEMGGVPAYAAVSQSVELAKVASPRAAGFVNGILQSLRRQAEPSTFPAFADDAAAHLTSWGSHPDWLVERWIARYGADAARRLVETNNRRPELYLRVLQTASPAAARDQVPDCLRDEVADRLREVGVSTEPVPLAHHALRVVAGSAAAALEAAPVIVQDPAAGLVIDFVGAREGTVLDLAAAPGGKALALALMTGRAAVDAEPGRGGNGREEGGAFVIAADRSMSRLGRLVDNARRLARPAPIGVGTVPVAAVVADARAAPFRQAATVLLDAPCTGTGTLRRHPDGRWRVKPQDLAALTALQAALLDAAASLVAQDGLLVYSTCSLEPEENEEQVSAFLDRRPDFALERGSGVDHSLIHTDGTLRVTPHEHGVDGAYCARLRRHTLMRYHAG